MKVNVVSGFKAQIEAAADLLKNSPDDHVVITSADNAVLVKRSSVMGDKMLAERMILFL